MPRVMCAAIIHEAEEVVKFTNGERLNLGERLRAQLGKFHAGIHSSKNPQTLPQLAVKLT